MRVGGVAQLGTTASDGSVTVRMPVVADPGSLPDHGAFAGDDVLPAVVHDVVPRDQQGRRDADVLRPSARGGGQQHLRGRSAARPRSAQEPVTFTVSGPGGSMTTVCGITD